MKLFLRWFVMVLALLAAAWLVPGIRVTGTAWVAYGVMALSLAGVNATVRPLLKLLGCPLVVLTLGLFLLVINAATLWLAARITQTLGFGFHVDGFWPAFWGALVVSVVGVLLGSSKEERK